MLKLQKADKALPVQVAQQVLPLLREHKVLWVHRVLAVHKARQVINLPSRVLKQQLVAAVQREPLDKQVLPDGKVHKVQWVLKALVVHKVAEAHNLLLSAPKVAKVAMA